MKEAEEQFIKYTNSYKKYGERILLKIQHTFRVERLCEELANSLELSQEEIDLAKLCGLLHDIGRFEQWKNYKTYDDLKSLDHGTLGETILKENNFIDQFTNNNHDTILRAVKYHNKYKVPNTLSKKNKMYVNITRDADKIDILQLTVNGPLALSTDNTKMTDSVYKTLFNKKSINVKDVKTKADAIAIRIAFLFDLNCKKSFEIIKEKNYMNILIENQLKETNNKELINQLKKLKIFINQYIEEMISC